MPCSHSQDRKGCEGRAESSDWVSGRGDLCCSRCGRRRWFDNPANCCSQKPPSTGEDPRGRTRHDDQGLGLRIIRPPPSDRLRSVPRSAASYARPSRRGAGCMAPPAPHGAHMGNGTCCSSPTSGIRGAAVSSDGFQDWDRLGRATNVKPTVRRRFRQGRIRS